MRNATFRRSIDNHLASLAVLKDMAGVIEGIATAIAETLVAGKKILTCGNGGSAAEALHLSEEMIGRFSRDRAPMASVCLAADPAAMTCIANDYGFDELFARQVEGLGRPGDVLVVMTTSGQSPNILRALERARSLKMTTIGFLGKAGSPAEPLCDIAMTMPEMSSCYVQEIHLVVTHLVLEYLDQAS